MVPKGESPGEIKEAEALHLELELRGLIQLRDRVKCLQPQGGS